MDIILFIADLKTTFASCRDLSIAELDSKKIFFYHFLIRLIFRDINMNIILFVTDLKTIFAVCRDLSIARLDTKKILEIEELLNLFLKFRFLKLLLNHVFNI